MPPNNGILKSKFYIVDLATRMVAVDRPYLSLSKALDAEHERGRQGRYTALSGAHILGVATNTWIIPGDNTLVVVPCSASKIWDRYPHMGLTHARRAYTSPLFHLGVEYAERYGTAWAILSAKHGFLNPHDLVGPYDVSFNRPSSNPIGTDFLAFQVAETYLAHYNQVIGLGGKHYQVAIQAAFAARPSVRLVFPFAGLPIGKTMRAIRQALDQPL